MRRLRVAVAVLVLGGALGAQHAVAASTTTTAASKPGGTTTTASGVPAGTTTTTPTTTTTTPSTTTTTTPSTTTTTPTPSTGVTVAPTPVKPTPHPKGGASGGGSDNQGADGGKKPDETNGKQGNKAGQGQNGAGAPVAPGAIDVGPVVPGPSCGIGISPPAALMPIYQQASDAYGLGPQGPGILAAINGIESGFGANLGPSSAGAVGWMQFMPSTWSVYGVDANGDGSADPNDPQDAIFAAARYLSAAGMPANTPSAIFAYNHADWYVEEVLADAACYGSAAGLVSPAVGTATVSCTPAKDTHIPETYMSAFEDAATRYDLGQRGVWALAAVARLESNYGRGMNAGQLVSAGPLGMDRDEWNRFEVDGDGNGRIDHADIYDAAATLAREFWSQGDLRAGIFLHNQAEWYVQQVLAESDQVSGKCTPTTGFATWTISLPQSSVGGLAGLIPQGAIGGTPWALAIYDGKEVCSWMVPILDAARRAGWQGQVVSGYRTFAEQVAIHNSGVFSAAPGESNHEGCAGLTYGSGNGAVDVSDPPSFAAAMAQLGNPLRNTLGAVDPEHFSPGGN